MKNKILFVILMITTIVSKAQYKVPTPFYGTDVHDYANILTTEQKKEIDKVILKMRNNSIEMAVVILKDLQGREIEDVSTIIFRSFGIGKKDINNGILYVIVPSMHKARIEIGYGLEGVLTDADTREIQENVKHFYKDEKFYEGILQITTSIEQKLTPEYLEQQKKYKEQKIKEEKDFISNVIDTFLILLLISAIVIPIIFYIRLKRKKEKEKRKEEEFLRNVRNELKKKIEAGNDLKDRFDKAVNTIKDIKKLFSIKVDDWSLVERYYSATNMCTLYSKYDINSLDKYQVQLFLSRISASHEQFYETADSIKRRYISLYSSKVYWEENFPKLDKYYSNALEEVRNTPYGMQQSIFDFLKKQTIKDFEYSDNLKLLISHYITIANYRKTQLAIKQREEKEKQETLKRRREEELRNNYTPPSYNNDTPSDNGNYGGGSSGGAGSTSDW